MAKQTVSQRFKSLGSKILLWLLAGSFFIGFMVVPNVGRSSREGAEQTFAVINGKHKITVREFLEAYRQMEYRFQEQYGDQWEQLKSYFLPQVKSFSIDRLIFRYGALDRARELGLNVSDEEIRRMVRETPAFHDEKGVFRLQNYQEWLQRRRTTAEKFENELREDLIRQKLTNLFYDGVRPSRAHVEQEWLDRNTKIALEFVSTGIAELASSMKPTEEQIRNYYNQNQVEFFRPERRVVRYADFNPASKEVRERDNVKNISDADIRAYYDQNAEEFTFTEENFRVREMVVGFDLGNPEDEALKKLSADEKKARAGDIIEKALARVRGGEDFAAVANEVSTDRREKLLKRGGDLGLISDKYFNKDIVGKAKALALGDTSDIFESMGAYRFIHVSEKFATGARKPFDDQKDAIRRKLANQRAQAVVDIESAAFLDKVRSSGLPATGGDGAPEIIVSPPFSRSEALAGIGRLGQDDEEAIFGTLKPGDAPRMARIGNRVIVYQLKDVMPPAPSPLEEVREQITERVKKQLARERIAADLDKARKAMSGPGGSAERAARLLKGAASGDTGVFSRSDSGSAAGASGRDVVNQIGKSGALKLAAFNLKTPGETAGPFEVEDKLVLIRLKSRQDPDPAQKESQMSELREEITRHMRNEIQQQLLDKIKAETTIDYRMDVDKLIGGDEADAAS